MKRIDTINARETMFGVGKSGFHDNADTFLKFRFWTYQFHVCITSFLSGVVK